MSESPENPPPAPSLGDRAAAGAGFMAAQMILTRIVGFVCNLALTALLAPEHFGILAMATTVVAIAGLVQAFGLREVLIRKQSSYRHLSTSCFWFSVITGLLCGLLMLAFAPLAVRYYNEPRLVGLLGIMAMSVPIGAMQVVPEAKLSIDLRFKWLSTFNSMVSIGSAVLTLVFAALGFKEYSLVLPRLIMITVRTVLGFRVSGFRPRLTFQFRRWRYFLGDSTWMFFSSFAMIIMLQADVVLLGNVVQTSVLGIFTWSRELSLQMMVMLAFSLGQVLMPALAKLAHNPQRQADAAIRACRMLGMVVVPTFLLQAAAIDPLINLLFKARWHDTIPILQILSIGMAGRFFGQPTQSLFQSQGRFRTWCFVACGCAASMVAGLIVAIQLARPAGTPTNDEELRIAMSVALAVSLWGVIAEPLGFLIAIRPAGRGVRDVALIVLKPLAVGVVGVGAGVLAMRFVPQGVVGPKTYEILRLFVLGAVSTPLLLVGTYLFMRPTLDDLLDRVGPMLGAVGIRRRGHTAHA
jgi:PST family polysaccharide transporter